LASHNRGPGSFFAGIWTLQRGDRIYYETTLGVRVFEVVSVEQIRETDLANLDHTHENSITL
jgi:LPXTG-site transpeptidase (sortase) family protein